MVPPSDELLSHHIRVHRRDCALHDWRAVLCPCGGAVALVCATCGEPVLVAVDEAHEPCEHALELLGEEAA